jgi:GcrA cell cycle regulator
MEWNDETIARIRALWSEGHSTAEIGRRMGISKNAVVGKAHRLSLPARPSPIRRGTGEKRASTRATIRRITGPTLPALQSVPRAVAPPAPVGFTPMQKPPVVLRPVPAQPRPSGRISSCCWPLGEPGTPDFHFCGDPTVPAKPYCDEHAALAYVKVRDRREDAA